MRVGIHMGYSSAEEVNLRLASHLWAVDVVKGIWDAVPSPNNGVTYCQGMCLIGEDPHTPVETWGMDKIFFAHARNQVRTGPCLMDHDEAPLEDGDVDMASCVRALVESNYDGVCRRSGRLRPRQGLLWQGADEEEDGTGGQP